jgi:superfamily II DNA helicase RecQ
MSCGHCDFCAPQTCIVQRFRQATIHEEQTAHRILKTLEDGITRATGKLHTEICPHSDLDRDAFEELLGALARAGLITLREASFEKGGKQIPYRVAQLTREGEEVDAGGPLALELREQEKSRASRKAARPEAKPRTASTEIDPADQPLFDALRAWRLAEAKNKNVPAFRIASDALLRGLTEDRPLTEEDLLALSGAGLAFVKRYAQPVLKIIHSFQS